MGGGPASLEDDVVPDELGLGEGEGEGDDGGGVGDGDEALLQAPAKQRIERQYTARRMGSSWKARAPEAQGARDTAERAGVVPVCVRAESAASRRVSRAPRPRGSARARHAADSGSPTAPPTPPPRG